MAIPDLAPAEATKAISFFRGGFLFANFFFCLAISFILSIGVPLAPDLIRGISGSVAHTRRQP
ncbi:MAG: hypothetical protein AUK20_00670 [Parcubacteria group bacterium CG2_30_45_37]|nr:MAG: hypothetical protein AUK20_00670 [Parcubacteria group bacterium CG2_30_45_37]